MHEDAELANQDVLRYQWCGWSPSRQAQFPLARNCLWHNVALSTLFQQWPQPLRLATHNFSPASSFLPSQSPIETRGARPQFNAVGSRLTVPNPTASPMMTQLTRSCTV